MIRALRRRLAVIFGLLTSLVLVVMLIITCRLACSQYGLSQEVLYQNQLQTLTRQVQQSPSLSDSWLSQISQDQDAFFYIETGGIPLHHSALSQQDPRQAELLEAFRAEAERLGYGTDADGLLTYQVQSGEASYRATVWTVDDYLMYYGQNTAGEGLHLASLVRTYVLLGIVGVSLLLLISGLLAHLSTRPTERALQEQQDFVAAASHELRSPLTVIRASLYAARQRPLEPEQARQLTLADQEAERMGRLTGDLLTLAGSGGGKWSAEHRPVELETVCIQLYEQFLPQAEEKQHPFRLELPEEPLPVIVSDVHRLVQLLTILLSNALDHTPPGTEVMLKAETERKSVSLAVIDHGDGIPDNEKEAVFRRFYRSDRSRTDKSHFGLGLAIAKELSDLLGGRLALEDTPGGGAAFVLKLPRGK